MHIVMVSDLETLGGAGIAATRLARALGASGHRVTRIVAKRERDSHSWQTIQLSFPLYERVAKGIVLGPIVGLTARKVLKRRLRKLLRSLRPDAISVHNIHWAASRGWPQDLIGVCEDSAPTLWTLHDMWSFTGRCAYSGDCPKYLTGCDADCPTPWEYPPLAPRLIAAAWQARRRFLTSHPDLAAVVPSRWLADVARSGPWAGHRLEVIPNGLPLGFFTPSDREIARKTLGITADGPVLLFTATRLKEPRKGMPLLEAALLSVRTRPLTLVTLGFGETRFHAEGIRVQQLGFAEEARLMVQAYNAADAVVHPAPVDNLPNTVMEAIACGTPVIAFPAGGLPELVRPGVTGWLADGLSPESLAAAIDRALASPEALADLRPQCRAVAEAEYDVRTQAQRYVELFEELAIHA